VGECLACVARGDVIRNDWEFPTLFGMSFGDFVVVAGAWPNVALDDERVIAATCNALNNLLGYPHRHNEIWGARIHAEREEVAGILAKLAKTDSGKAMPNTSLERTRER
jgi:hypothetical protein